MKRIFDICISCLALIILFPVMILVALTIRLKLGSPVMFAQERPGLHGEPFMLLKFRTMLDLRESDGEPLPDEKRLTKFGKLLRSTSLDELPEFLNVLRGDMSIVGPRPLLMEYLSLYSREQMRRHEVRPGLTGWAQVNGRNKLGWQERFKLDVWYVEHVSATLDIKIILLTIIQVLGGKGVSQDGHVTMNKFRGNDE